MRTIKDFFIIIEIHYIEQLLNTIKLAEDCIVSNSKFLRLKRGYNIGFIGLSLENKALKR